jgi:hypothetical protein
VNTPELDKRAEVLDEARTLSEFYDWLGQQGVHLMVWRTDITDTRSCLEFNCIDGKVSFGSSQRDCTKCGGTGWREVTGIEDWVEDSRRPEQLFADYFGIDLNKVEQEQAAILDELRGMSSG